MSRGHTYTCDHCGLEVKGGQFAPNRWLSGLFFDLCPVCAEELIEWVFAAKGGKNAVVA